MIWPDKDGCIRVMCLECKWISKIRIFDPYNEKEVKKLFWEINHGALLRYRFKCPSCDSDIEITSNDEHGGICLIPNKSEKEKKEDVNEKEHDKITHKRYHKRIKYDVDIKEIKKNHKVKHRLNLQTGEHWIEWEE